MPFAFPCPSYAKTETDRATKRAYADLCPEDRARLTELLLAVRARASVRVCPELVAVLRNVARFGTSWLRSIDEWPGASGSIYPVVHSLVQHLLARHEVPRFLASVWYGDASPSADAKRRWFIAHAAGARFRELDLPMTMTRKMEAIFLASPDHLSVEAALRRAEILALGGNDALVAAVQATRLGAELSNGAFWRTVLQLFARFGAALAPDAVGPIVDFLQNIRHERVEVLSRDGTRVVDPPEPSFSVQGRSLASLQRLVESWHTRLGNQPVGAMSWPASTFRPLAYEEPTFDPERPPVRWQVVELTSAADLHAEGRALHHCVAAYARLCLWGHSRIWSLRRVGSSARARPVTTIEVDPRMRSIVQARGFRNAPPPGRARGVISLWARRENLALRI